MKEKEKKPDGRGRKNVWKFSLCPAESSSHIARGDAGKGKEGEKKKGGRESGGLYCRGGPGLYMITFPFKKGNWESKTFKKCIPQKKRGRGGRIKR